MGFFSAIKKFLGSESTEKEDKKEQGPEADLATSADAVAPVPLAEPTNPEGGTSAEVPSQHIFPTEAVAEDGLPEKSVEEEKHPEEISSQEQLALHTKEPSPESVATEVSSQEMHATDTPPPADVFDPPIVTETPPIPQEQSPAAPFKPSLEDDSSVKEPLPPMPPVPPMAEHPETTVKVEATEALEEALKIAGIEEVEDNAKTDSHATPEAPSQTPTAVGSIFEIEGLSAEDQAALSLALRQEEPRLSAWLNVILDGMSTVSPLLWQRLRYLLQSLDAKPEEATAFVDDFAGWLTRMEYEYIEEFRSELQYRLALALELEDEEDERNRLLVKLSDGLARTREQFTRKLDALFASHGALDAAFWEEMEELFITADVGFESSMQLIERLKDGVRKQGLSEPHELRTLLQEEVEKIFQMPKRISSHNPPEVVMMVGVNGVGKTTTIAKLAHRDRMQGKKVLIAAADTFRAAATEQLGVWAERVGADFHRKEAGADPAAVAFEAMDIALRNDYDVIYIDTAGRLQTKVNLMEELKKIRNVIGKKHNGAPHRCILVIDATTGQNALSQTKMFHDASGVDEIILSKLDGTAKGGVAISVAMQFSIPITYVGLGEKLEDLRPFNGKDFAGALLGAEETPKQ